MMIIFAFKKGELKVKTQDANFSLPFKNPNPLLKNGFRIQIKKLGLFGYGLPILIFTKTMLVILATIDFLFLKNSISIFFDVAAY